MIRKRQPVVSPGTAALRVAVGAFIAGAVWIIATTLVANLLPQSEEQLHRTELLKGLLFVGLTALLLFLYVRRVMTSIESSHDAEMQAKLDLVNRLALAAEYKDDLEGGHNFRIGKSSEIIARHLGVEQGKCDLLGHAAVLHDIGKIGIPDSILSKEGPLTPEERRIMEKHVVYGAHLLSGSEHALLMMARSVSLYHHEKWDGTGYPYALKGEEIPLEGRIVAVCDVFDALTSTRSYKEAWSTDKACGFIVGFSGRHFDPKVVKAFLEGLDEIIALRYQEPDPGWLRQPLSLPSELGAEDLVWIPDVAAVLELPSEAEAEPARQLL
ncbi:MAG: HD domain-containing protein [Armatimonadetes bacterium]|nr:HD domain-containing protein [Armatimonadota bacterium]